jgi:hypothetical protein
VAENLNESHITDGDMERARALTLLLASNIDSFSCGELEEGIVATGPRFLSSHWSFPEHRVFRHAVGMLA